MGIETEKLVHEDLARSGLVPEDVHGLKIVGLEAMKPLPGAQQDEGFEAEEGYDPDDYDEDAPEADPADGFEAVGGYTIPYLSFYGKPVKDNGKKFQRVRLVGRKMESVPRYRSPRGSGNHVYIPQGLRDLLVRITHQRGIGEAENIVDILFITEGEKKAVRAVKAGIPCVALPGVTMWTNSELRRRQKAAYIQLGGNPKDLKLSKDTPVNPELLEAIEQAKALCPSIGVVCVLFDSDGLPVPYKDAFTKTKNGRVPNGGVDWMGCDVPGRGADSFVSANPQVTSAGYTLAAALRKQATSRAVVTTRFCDWDDKDDDHWQKQGLDDWLQAEPYPGSVTKRLKGELETALRLWDVVKDEPLFNCSADPDTLGAKGGPSAELAFAQLLDGNRVGEADELLYEWAGSHWQLVPYRNSKKAAYLVVSAFYRDCYSSHKVSEAAKGAVSAGHLYGVPEPITGTRRENGHLEGAVIPCADLTLDIAPDGTVTAREPRKEDGLRYCVNAKWADKDKPSPEFDRFIQATLPDPAVRRLVQQYVGYTLIGDSRYQVAQWWFGSGANGKGFLSRIVGALHRKVAAVNIEDLGGFEVEGLIDASLISVDETPKRIDEQRLKSLISGDVININRKFQTPVSVNIRAKWLLRGNEKPALTDQTDGIWRRLHIIEFTEKFEGDRRDNMLADRIIATELPGVLRWAIEGLQEVLRADGFRNIPESVQAAKREMQVETDNVLGWWVAKEVQVCDAPRADKDMVYRNYSVWCKDNGMMPLGMPRFWTRVRSIVERDYGKLRESRPQERVTDPIDGTTKTVRTLRVNLDIDARQRDEGDDHNNVVPLPATPLRASTAERQVFVDVMTGTPPEGYDDLDSSSQDDDWSAIPF
jgi:putative DNA primase/helicase